MSEIKKYTHKVQYYETDQMGIVHHSNYIRWFEEARTDFMEQMGLGYEQMEERGIVGPFEGSKPRQLLITKEKWQEMKMGGTGKDAPEEPPEEE